MHCRSPRSNSPFLQVIFATYYAFIQGLNHYCRTQQGLSNHHHYIIFFARVEKEERTHTAGLSHPEGGLTFRIPPPLSALQPANFFSPFLSSI